MQSKKKNEETKKKDFDDSNKISMIIIWITKKFIIKTVIFILVI